MPSYLSSGSAIERSLLCSSSVALPHAHHESEWTEQGSVLHFFLESCSSSDRETALAAVPDDYRDACAELNLEGLDAHLDLAAEVAFAYDYETDSARELGRGVGRIYDDVKPTEIPCTLDVVGVRTLPSGVVRGLYADWKTGWQNRRAISDVTQIDFGALCIARAYGCDLVEGQLIHVHEDFAPWVQRKVMEGFELDAFASLIRERAREWSELRAKYQGGLVPRDFNTGPHCEGCPAREWCPAQSTMLRSVLSKDLFDGALRMTPIPESALVDVWNQIHAAQSVLSLLKSKLMAIAATRPVKLGRTETGEIRWLMKVITEGNEKLDGEAVFDVVAELHGEDAAYAATEIVTSKKLLEETLKTTVPRGQKAAALRVVLDRLRKSGGATRKIGSKIVEVELADGEAPWNLAADETAAREKELHDRLVASLPAPKDPE